MAVAGVNVSTVVVFVVFVVFIAVVAAVVVAADVIIVVTTYKISTNEYYTGTLTLKPSSSSSSIL